MDTRSHFTLPQAARAAGIGYLVIIVCGLFAEFGVRQALYDPSSADKTLANIAASEMLFLFGIASDLVMLLADVLVALMLCRVFESVHKGLSMLAAMLRLVPEA